MSTYQADWVKDLMKCGKVHTTRKCPICGRMHLVVVKARLSNGVWYASLYCQDCVYSAQYKTDKRALYDVDKREVVSKFNAAVAERRLQEFTNALSDTAIPEANRLRWEWNDIK